MSDKEEKKSGDEKKEDDLPGYTSDETLFSSDIDDEEQPFPINKNYPPRHYVFNREWTQNDERTMRRFAREGKIQLQGGLKAYDKAVKGEIRYWKDRTVRDRLRRYEPERELPEPKLPELADNEVPYHVRPEGK